MPEPKPLFPKIKFNSEAKNIPGLIKAEKVSNKNTDDLEGKIDFDDFQKMDLRVGHIKSCHKIDKSDKLLYSEVDLGEGRCRKIISGVAEFYEPTEMINRKVLVLSNLKTIKLMGEVSEGMILFSNDQRDHSENHPVDHLNSHQIESNL